MQMNIRTVSISSILVDAFLAKGYPFNESFWCLPNIVVT